MKKSVLTAFLFLLPGVVLFAGLEEAKEYSATAMAKFKKNDLKGALADYDKSLAEYPDNAGALCNRGQVKAALRRYEEAVLDYNVAIDVYKQIIEEQGSQPQFLTGLAEAYFARGISRGNLKDIKGAIEDYTLAIKYNPRHAKAYFNRGTNRSDLKDIDGAIDDYSKAIGLDQSYIKAYYNRAMAKYEKKDHRGAIDDLTRVIKLDPRNANAYYARGIINSGYQDKADAISDLFMASQLGHPEALKKARYITGADGGVYGK